MGNKIPQILEHELDDATLEGQADEIAAEFRKTVENLGKDRPLKKAFRQEIEQIYNEELEKGKAQGLKAEEAEFYAKIQATRIMWDSAYTGLSPKFIAEQAAIELRNERETTEQGTRLYQGGKGKNYNSRINPELNVNDEISLFNAKETGEERRLRDLFGYYAAIGKKV